MYDTIIWATDGSAGADLALGEALRIAELTGGRIFAVHCDQQLVGRAAGWPALADESDRRLKVRSQVEQLRQRGVDIDILVRKSRHEPADVVAEIAADADADVIVCGTRGLGAFAGAVLGSFTLRLLHLAPCPVLAVPEVALRVTVDAPERTTVLA